MKPSTYHFGGIALAIAGVAAQIAGAASVVPGNVGFYSGLAAQILAVVLHTFNTPTATK